MGAVKKDQKPNTISGLSYFVVLVGSLFNAVGECGKNDSVCVVACAGVGVNESFWNVFVLLCSGNDCVGDCHSVGANNYMRSGLDNSAHFSFLYVVLLCVCLVCIQHITIFERAQVFRENFLS